VEVVANETVMLTAFNSRYKELACTSITVCRLWWFRWILRIELAGRLAACLLHFCPGLKRARLARHRFCCITSLDTLPRLVPSLFLFAREWDSHNIFLLWLRARLRYCCVFQVE